MTQSQRRVFIGCFVVYSGAYIARLNLAAALPTLMRDLALTQTQGGLLQTVFAVVYALGQLVNGALVDRISPRRHIVIGLVGSAACNALIGAAGAYWQVLVLWMLNGAAQSMLWTPVVKLLAGWFSGAQRKRISMWIAFTMVLGHFVAWAISGFLAQLVTWRLSFCIPAAVAAGLVAVALGLLRDPQQAEGGGQEGARQGELSPAMPFGKLLVDTGLWLVLICCAASGFVRDGVMAWGPDILASLRQEGAWPSPAALSLLIPAINLLGVLLGQFLLRRAAGNTRLIIVWLMGAGALASLALIAVSGAGVVGYALMLGVCCALMNGVNPLETVVLPMDYARFGRVGLVAGLIDGFVYVGAAFAGVSTGFLRSHMGLGAVFTAWALVAALGAAAMLLSIIRTRAAMRG